MGYDKNNEAKLVWAKKVLQEMVENRFCGNVQFNFQQGTIVSKEVREFEKAPS